MNYDNDGNPVDPREEQEGWDTHVRGLLNAADFNIVRLGELEYYIDEGYIDINNDTLYSYIFDCEIPLLCIAIESHAPLPILYALLDRGADINSQTERRINTDGHGDYDLSWFTPMSVAIRKGNVSAVEALLDYGVDPLEHTCWKCSVTLSSDASNQIKPRDRPREIRDAVRYAIDMGQPQCVSALVRYRRVPPHKLDPHIGYLKLALSRIPLPSRATFSESLEIVEEARTLYTHLDAAECSLWTMKYAIRRHAWRDLGPVVARHILADVVAVEEEGDDEKEPVSKKIKV
jgi:hypothetical protein